MPDSVTKTTTRAGTCRRMLAFPEGGYATIGNDEEWEPVVKAARRVDYVERADQYDAEWEEVYVVFAPESMKAVYYYVRSDPDAPEIPLPKIGDRPKHDMPWPRNGF